MTDTAPKEYQKPYEVEPTKQKQKVVRETTEKLNRSVGAIVMDYRGLSVSELTELRRLLDASDAEFQVIKNTLLRISADQAGVDFGDMLSGPTAVAILYGDPIAPAKAFREYLDTHKNVDIKGGYLEGKAMSADQINALAKIPPKEVLLAQLLAGFNGPVTSFVGTLNSIVSNFVFTLQAVADKKGESA